jgi:hypothetical protein
MKSAFRFLSVLLIIGLIVPAGALAEKEIKIGAIYPLTGGAAAAGRELRAGAELAAEIANNVMADINMSMAKNGGIKSMGGAKITIIFKDHEGNPTLGADLGLLPQFGDQNRQCGSRTARYSHDQRDFHITSSDKTRLQMVLANHSP